MRTLTKIICLSLLFLILSNVVIEKSSSKIQKEEETCSEPVYSPKQVSRKAKIIDMPNPAYTEEARAKGISGTVVLSLVLCRTGKVTDIKVLKSLPYGLTENAVESTRQIKFEPAEKDGQAVSQRILREINFDVY
jgi:TonB family protein